MTVTKFKPEDALPYLQHADENKGVVIVALPEQDDAVCRYSSEPKPHITLLYLGDQTDNLEDIIRYVEHASSMMQPFYLTVDRRGTLGPKNADVLFFEKDWLSERVGEFREGLLANTSVIKAYHSSEQFPEWIPHLTMGYPEAPAKPDNRDYPGIHSVNFDRIAVWTGDYDGPEFQLQKQNMDMLMSEEVGKFLAHYGVKGQKWKHHKAPNADVVNPPGLAPTHKHRVTALSKEAKAGLSPQKRREINIATQKARAELTKITDNFRNWVDTHPKATPAEIASERAKSLNLKKTVVNNLSSAIAKVSAPAKVVKPKSVPHVVLHDDMVGEFLAHFGIKGMRWGIRRPDGPAGTVSSNPASKPSLSDDASRANTTLHTIKRGGGTAAISTADMQHLIQRMNVEKQFADFNASQEAARLKLKTSKLQKADSAIRTVLKYGGTLNKAIQFANSDAGRLLSQSLHLTPTGGTHANDVKGILPKSVLPHLQGVNKKGKKKK